jgi:hypothetical protein
MVQVMNPASLANVSSGDFGLTDEEFRKTGFTGDARKFPLSQKGFEWLCRFNGLKPEQAPRTWRFAPNQYMQKMLNDLGEDAIK